MQFVLIASFVIGLLLAASRAAPSVSVISDTQLDAKGIFFVSYDGVVNVNSFQLSGVLTYSNYQYAAWYTSTKYAILGRRQLPSGGWSTLQLPHQLSTSDSHNVIALGISPSDGKVHVALDCHSTKLYYTSSEAGLATSGASWTASRFGSITNTLGNLNIGRLVGYAYFYSCIKRPFILISAPLRTHNSWSPQTISYSLSIDLAYQATALHNSLNIRVVRGQTSDLGHQRLGHILRRTERLAVLEISTFTDLRTNRVMLMLRELGGSKLERCPAIMGV